MFFGGHGVVFRRPY